MEQSKHETAEDYYYKAGLLFPLLVFFCGRFLKRFLQSPCLFHLLTGYYCPGCGGRRAVEALLRGKFLASLYYNPLVVYGLGLYLAFMFSQTLERLSGHRLQTGLKYKNFYVYFLLVLTGANFILKNLLHYWIGFSL